MTNAKDNDERDLKDFYKENFNLFTSFACNYIKDIEVGKDIVQDVFTKYWKKLSSLDDALHVKAYVYKAIRNECLNYKRHSKVRESFAQNHRIESQEYFLDAIITEESSDIIYRAINSLSEMGRKVIFMAMDNKSNEEIAAELGISVNTVKTHKQRSYSALRKRFGELDLLIALVAAILH